MKFSSSCTYDGAVIKLLSVLLNKKRKLVNFLRLNDKRDVGHIGQN